MGKKYDLNSAEDAHGLFCFFFLGESHTRAKKHPGRADDKASGQAPGRM